MKPTNRQVENDRCAWAEAEKYLALSYDELAKIERAFHAHTDHPPQWVDCCGQEALADIRICKLGLFRPRITVEVILTGGGDDSPRVTSIVYFQRFRSGRLNVWGPAPVPHKYDRKRHNREEGWSQAEAPGETIMTDDEILSVIDAIHDRWFSVEDIEFDPAARTWSVPFSVGPTMRPPRAPSLRGVAGTPVLEVRGVDSFELTDTEQVGWYDFNVIKWRPAEGVIDIVTGVPFGLTLHVSSPEIRIVKQR